MNIFFSDVDKKEWKLLGNKSKEIVHALRLLEMLFLKQLKE